MSQKPETDPELDPKRLLEMALGVRILPLPEMLQPEPLMGLRELEGVVAVQTLA